MANDILLYIGSTAIILWGITHIIFTKGVVSGFDPISKDNKLVIKMEWIAEGLTLIFIGLPYAFYVKPMILRRRSGPSPARAVKVVAMVGVLLTALAAPATAAVSSIS